MPSVRVIFAVAVCLSATVVASVDESEPNAPDDTVVIEGNVTPIRLQYVNIGFKKWVRRLYAGAG